MAIHGRTRLHGPDGSLRRLRAIRGLPACVPAVAGGAVGDVDHGQPGQARQLRAAGGFVLVQAPETAKFDSMPRSTITATTLTARLQAP